jgi:membrane protease YdiL (CAAX protease family)
MVEREPPGPQQHQRQADGQHRQRQLDPADGHEGLDRPRLYLEQCVRQLHDEGGHEHRAGQEERIDTRQKAGDEEDRTGDLRPGGEVSEEGGDAVIRSDVGGEGGGSTLTGDLRPAVGEEDQSRRDAQEQQRQVSPEFAHRGPTSVGAVRRMAIAADRYIAPLVLFVFVYVATLLLAEWVRFPFIQWTGLICVTAATLVTVGLVERWRWPLGLFVPPRLASRDFLVGIAFGVALIGSCALLVVLTTDVRHGLGRGFPWGELALVFLPAVVHEELLFRGYPFQKLVAGNRIFAVVFVALVFAALHAGNSAVTPLALANIFLGGILLGLAYLRFQRLWFPIGLHLAWNLMTGPILGHEVSGYISEETVLTESGHGPWWLSGGEFGIEGSVLMTAVELAAIGLLLSNIIRRLNVSPRSR